MWEGHFSQIKTDKGRIELRSVGKQPIHLEAYQGDPRAPKLENHEIDKMLAMKLMELIQTEWTSPIVLTPK